MQDKNLPTVDGAGAKPVETDLTRVDSANIASDDQGYSVVEDPPYRHPATKPRDDIDMLRRHFGPHLETTPTDPADEVQASPEPVEAPSLMSAADWQDIEVPEQDWAVPNRVPNRTVTLLSGDGGLGKSLITGQLLVAMALGRDWLDSIPTAGASIYFNAEDDEAELHRRFGKIVQHYGASFRDLEGIRLMLRAGKDAVLGEVNRSGRVNPTELFGFLTKATYDLRPKIVAIDTAADVFAGNENDRAQVRQFIGILRGLAIECNTSVLLLSHPSATGLNSGLGTSGSTGWNNSARSRLYLKRPKSGDSPDLDRDLRELEVMKSNYGPVGELVRLRWSNGLFLPDVEASPLDRAVSDQRDEEIFLRVLRRFIDQGQTVGPNTGANYAPLKISRHEEAKGVSSRRLAAAMQRLLDRGSIRIVMVGPPSKQRKQLAMGPGK
jgi:RecA-family ATPase